MNFETLYEIGADLLQKGSAIWDYLSGQAFEIFGETYSLFDMFGAGMFATICAIIIIKRVI